MNLIEAIKSKRPFKRPQWENFCTVADINHPIYNDEQYAVFMYKKLYGPIDIQDLLADDYEITKNDKDSKMTKSSCPNCLKPAVNPETGVCEICCHLE